MASDIKIFTTKSCPYCVRAKAFFKNNDLEFEEHDLTGNSAEIERLKNETGHRTVPLIFIDQVFIGGYTDMMHKIAVGQLTLTK